MHKCVINANFQILAILQAGGWLCVSPATVSDVVVEQLSSPIATNYFDEELDRELPPILIILTPDMITWQT